MKFNAAFWKWFGDSKVVNASGQPLVVYHAGRSDFNVFDIDRCELGCHFGTEKQAKSVHETHSGTHLRRFYLSIKNPLRMQDHTGWYADAVADELKHLGVIPKSSKTYNEKELRSALILSGHDGFVYLNRHEGLTESDWDMINKSGLDIDGEASDAEMKRFLPWLRDSWMVFDPAQIKSVDNDGTWDSGDPDIRSNPDVKFLKEFRPQTKGILIKGKWYIWDVDKAGGAGRPIHGYVENMVNEGRRGEIQAEISKDGSSGFLRVTTPMSYHDAVSKFLSASSFDPEYFDLLVEIEGVGYKEGTIEQWQNRSNPVDNLESEAEKILRRLAKK